MRSARVFAVASLLLASCGGASASRGIDVRLSQCGGPTSVRAPCVVDQLVAAARADRDVVALSCASDKRDAMEPLLGVLRSHWGDSDADVGMRAEIDRRLEVLELEAEHCHGFDIASTHVEVARQ